MAAEGFLGLPLGVTFDPTDEELIEYYLFPKLNGCYADYGVVTDANVFELDPGHLKPLARYDPGDGNLYFFAPRTRSSPNGSRAKRTTDKRGWVFTDRPQDVRNRDEQLIGQRRLFVYKIGGKNTPWRLHEYRLHGIYESLSSSSSGVKGKGKATVPLYLDLVLCRVWFKSDDKSKSQAYNPLAAAEQYQQHFEEQQPSCSYYQEEENHQSEVPNSSVPVLTDNCYTTLLETMLDLEDSSEAGFHDNVDGGFLV